MNDIAKALSNLRPGAQWLLEGNNISGLTWLDNQELKPSNEEIIFELDKLGITEEEAKLLLS